MLNSFDVRNVRFIVPLYLNHTQPDGLNLVNLLDVIGDTIEIFLARFHRFLQPIIDVRLHQTPKKGNALPVLIPVS